jgi:hypothetical protein
MPANRPACPSGVLLLAVLLLAGCAAATAADKAPDTVPTASGAAPAAVQARAVPAPRPGGPAPPAEARRWEPAPVPRITLGEDRARWNPTRSAYGWPDRFSGAPAGGPFRPRL